MTKQISIRLADDEAEVIEKLAAEDGRSLTNYTRRVLLKHIDETKNGAEHE